MMPSHPLIRRWLRIFFLFSSALDDFVNVSKLRVIFQDGGRYLGASGGCFTNVSWALQTVFRNLCIAEIRLFMRISSRNVIRVPKAMLTCTNFRLEIFIINVICGIAYFHEIILDSLRNVSETSPCHVNFHYHKVQIWLQTRASCSFTRWITAHPWLRGFPELTYRLLENIARI